jgi:hypothetical protein
VYVSIVDVGVVQGVDIVIQMLSHRVFYRIELGFFRSDCLMYLMYLILDLEGINKDEFPLI